jgi:hypothetical protein
MYVWVPPERFEIFYSYSLYNVNANITSPKIGVLHVGSKSQNDDFLEKGSNDFLLISVNYGDLIPK